MTIPTASACAVSDEHDAWWSLPPSRLVRRIGEHTLVRVADDWYVLVGPDDMTDLAWVVPAMPRGDWAVGSFESYGDILITHFHPRST